MRLAVAMGQTSLFGQPQQQQQAQPSAFGAKPMGFGQPTTSTASTFGFGQAAPQQQQASIFGQPQQAKPFGASIFGAPTTSQPAPAFGTQAPATAFGFGAPQQVHTFLLSLRFVMFLMCVLNYYRLKAFSMPQSQLWDFRLRQQGSVSHRRPLRSRLDQIFLAPNQLLVSEPHLPQRLVRHLPRQPLQRLADLVILLLLFFPSLYTLLHVLFVSIQVIQGLDCSTLVNLLSG